MGTRKAKDTRRRAGRTAASDAEARNAPTTPGGANGAPSSALRGEFAYAQLRADIRGGKLMPGDRLRETEIADRLNVSRTPVREALKRLESEGLVVFSQPRGMTVAELAPGQVLELYAMREVLEGAAARFAAEHASALGLSGFVRNMPAGEVEVVAEGDRKALEALLVHLRRGPPRAQVLRVETSWIAYSGKYAGFRISY